MQEQAGLTHCLSRRALLLTSGIAVDSGIALPICRLPKTAEKFFITYPNVSGLYINILPMYTEKKREANPPVF